ncbi:MAG TPA: SsrA-binding protein SmpB [Anaerolineaceae bacterium]|jgi:SsrA-binding protein|nr:SsrA-binding protein SmpB [Anaerolineaceae bacterium]HQK05090.1 SsrA-binding protein SmpB [Anaerolineaceae bacterium]HQM55398.1 SsrA-binding protein SmpB [Anaerolineaceae bacterium]HUM62200.1 SsrA-binding protein SmpB [Anaerolineaceae bacterium]
MNVKIVSKNRKALFEYFILEKFEAGIALMGSEIKSVRAGKVSLQEAYIKLDEQQAWLVNAHIASYQAASYSDHDPKRPRRLLLNKKEIRLMWNEVRQKGVTIIPVSMYLKDGKAKLEIAIAKGKKLYDKRRDIADKDMKREQERARIGRNSE